MHNQRLAPLYASLKAHHRRTAGRSILSAFADDPRRFEGFSLRLGSLLMDYSKTALDKTALGLLVKLAEAADLSARRDAMFAGEAINTTEHRAVLHTALRNLSSRPVLVGGRDVMGDIRSERERCEKFSEAIRKGTLCGATGQKLTTIVNIGIGGSDLGPAMAAQALRPFIKKGLRCHFVSNVDGAHISDVLAECDARRTLFIISSKTFTTVETLTNARTARAWLVGKLGEAAVSHHFAAVSTNLKAVEAFGIEGSRMFRFWDWVGGRYSVWSSIGLPLMIAIGPRQFQRFLAGAHRVDEHFRTAPLRRNMPVLMGLIGIWHRTICGYASHAVLPYDQRLSRFAAHLQQLDMESLGKRVQMDGSPVAQASGPVVWGEPGTNGQHAFFQLLHQGSDIVPADFLFAAEGHDGLPVHHDLLVANALAQTQALMKGRTQVEALAQLLEKGMDRTEAERLAPHRVFEGNRPSVTFLYPRLDPFMLGALIALYEHKIFVMATIWNINAFDQWGVELGKELALALEPALSGKDVSGLDGSTAGLIAALKAMRKP